ncbi:MAG: Gfo/Idh/MocA family oxidoreductase [Lentisphaeria bacterium]|nr:Gfo/Idh/MocA family oxidoreductase [Lentisphaeria bacterium]
MLNWGIIGTGRIAGTFIRALQAGTGGRPLIVLGRDPERTRRFAAENKVPESTANLRVLLLDPRIDAVYVATPHTTHAELSIAALKAGKPVLCEKPMALDAESTESVLATSRECGKLFLEGYMYRWHPQTAKLIELLRAEAVGKVNLIESAFGFAAKYDPADRLFDPALGGGAIRDIGGYPLSMAMLVAGTVLGREPGTPDRLIAGGVTAPGNIDLTSCAIAVWGGRIAAQLCCSCGATLDAALRIHGSEGRIVVPNPWVCNRTEPEEGVIRIERGSGTEVIRVPADRTSFGYEADGFARLLKSGAREAAAAPFTVAESSALNRQLCDWFKAVVR